MQTIVLLVIRLCDLIEELMSIQITTKTTGKMPDFAEAATKASEAVAREFPTRAKPKVKQAVKASYSGVKVAKIAQAVAGQEVSGSFASIKYKAGVSSLKDFGLTPRGRPKGKRVYTLKVNVKGGRSFGGKGTPYFVDPNGHAFKRIGGRSTATGNTKIERLNTLSVVSMIKNDALPEIDSNLEEMVDNRMEHYLRRFLGL